MNWIKNSATKYIALNSKNQIMGLVTQHRYTNKWEASWFASSENSYSSDYIYDTPDDAKARVEKEITGL